MSTKFLLSAASVFLAALPSTPAAAAVLIVNSSGLLTGATAVEVDGSLYDVEFLDGTCTSVFGTCATSSFAFQTQALAQSAARALLDQVFLGIYDDDVTLTQGCPFLTSPRSGCLIGIPYAATATTFDTAFAQNRSKNIEASWGPDSSTFRWLNREHSYNTGNQPGELFARFTFTGDVIAVPEPATWAMMLGGFGLIGAAARRRKPNVTYA